MCSRRKKQAVFLPMGLLFTVLIMSAGLVHAEAREPTDEELETWRASLRESFDDIHNVSMRFHLDDPSIGGLIGLRLTWEGGRLVQGEVLSNETGVDAEAQALLEAIRGWEIPGLEGPVSIQTAFRIRLVGSDDPSFPDRGIITGTVKDGVGKPVPRASIRFEPEEEGMGEANDARSNREGVFVRTLIPSGEWTVVVEANGFEPYRSSTVTLAPGSHHIEHVVLARP